MGCFTVVNDPSRFTFRTALGHVAKMEFPGPVAKALDAAERLHTRLQFRRHKRQRPVG
jgi:hypothetical protein